MIAPARPIKILIADDHPLLQDGFKNLLRKEPQMEVVAVAANGREVLSLVPTTTPDVIVLDIQMPLMDGMATCKQLTLLHPSVAVIAFSMFDEEEYVLEMLEAGAKGYVLKNTDKEELVKAIRIVYEGGEYHCRPIKERIFKLMRQGKLGNKSAAQLPQFSPTEINIIKLLCREYTSKGIADALQLTHRTIEHYKAKIQLKMDVTTSMGIVFYALKHRLIKPDEVEQLQ